MGESSPTNNRGRLGEKSELFSREERSGTEEDVATEQQAVEGTGAGRGNIGSHSPSMEKGDAGSGTTIAERQ